MRLSIALTLLLPSALHAQQPWSPPGSVPDLPTRVTVVDNNDNIWAIDEGSNMAIKFNRKDA
jgi:hypothetical protein